MLYASGLWAVLPSGLVAGTVKDVPLTSRFDRVTFTSADVNGTLTGARYTTRSPTAMLLSLDTFTWVSSIGVIRVGASVPASAAAWVVVRAMVVASITRTKNACAPGVGGLLLEQPPELAGSPPPMIDAPPRGSYQMQSPLRYPWPDVKLMVSFAALTAVVLNSDPSLICPVPPPSSKV